MRERSFKSASVLLAVLFALVAAFTGLTLLFGSRTHAAADGEEGAPAGKVLYYVDAGYYVANSDGTGDILTRSGTPGYPAKVETPFMMAYGLSFGTADSGMYNSVTDKPYSDHLFTKDSYSYQAAYADPITGREWGFDYIKADGTSNIDNVGHEWRSWQYGVVDCKHELEYANKDVPGFQTVRYSQGNNPSAWEGAIVYTFEVDDDSTPLKLQFGTAGAAENWGDQHFHVTVNGSESEADYKSPQRGTAEYVYDGEVKGAKKGEKYYVTVKFGNESEQPFISYILLTTADYQHRDLYTGVQVAKKGATTFEAISNEGETATATLDETNQEIITAANYGDRVKVTATIDGDTYKNLSVTVIPDHTYYFVNVAGDAYGDSILADGLYTADTKYGYVADGSVGHNGAAFPGSTGWENEEYFSSVRQDMDKIVYRFDVVEGDYKVIVGVAEHWSQYSPKRNHTFSANGGASVNVQSANNIYRSTAYATCEGHVGEDGALNVTIERSDAQQEAMGIAYILVYSDGHVLQHETEKEATCTEDGHIEYYYCAGCDTYFTDGEASDVAGELTISALGHDYDYAAADAGDGWTWTATDDGYTVTLTATCKNDSTHTDVKTATVAKQVKKEATETEDGEIEYTATVTIGDDTYTDTKTVTIPATGSGEEPPVTEEKVTVTFDLNGGTGTAPAQTIDKGGKVTKPANPTKEGYDFAGWYTEAEGGTEWNFEENAVNSNITLYAHWTENGTGGEEPPVTEDKVTVTFDLNGGTGTAPAQTIDKGGKVTKPANPTKEGYTFAGWYTAASGGTEWNFETGTVTANLTLYAIWTENTPSTPGTGDDTPGTGSGTTTEPAKKKGCGSAVMAETSAIVAALMLAFAGMVIFKKKAANK